MDIPLTPEMQRFVDQKLAAGEYARAEDVVQAGLTALQQQEGFGDFETCELDELLAAGERSIEAGGTIDARDVMGRLQARSAQRRGKSA